MSRARRSRVPERFDLATLAKKVARQIAAGPNEHADQCSLAYWARTHQDRYPSLRNFAFIPNQAGRDLDPKGKGALIRQAKMKKEGLSPGYPDNLLDVARGGYHGLRVELKRRSHWNDRTGAPYAAGEPSPDQVAWHKRLAAEGYSVWIAWGWEPARDIFLWYLALPPRSYSPLDLPLGTGIPRTRHILL